MKNYLTCLVFFFATTAYAQVLSGCEYWDKNQVTPSANRIKQLLKDKQFNAVEDEIQDKLKRISSNEYSDLLLIWTMRRSMKGDVALEPILIQWVNERPQSFVARLIKGIFHTEMAYQKRGASISNSTSQEQMQSMESELGKAATELQVARKIKSDTGLAVAQLMYVARPLAGAGAVADLLMEAERVEPRNLAARDDAIESLSPKWGGSFEAIDALLDRAVKQRLPAGHIRYLQYRVEMQKADHYDFVTKEKTKAIEHWKKAAALCANAELPWSSMSTYVTQLEDWKTLKEISERSIALSPNSALAIQRRGYALEKLGQMPEAIKDYERASELGEPWAQGRLGYFYMMGQSVPKDWVRARNLLESAVNKGNQGAKQSLDWLKRQTSQN